MIITPEIAMAKAIELAKAAGDNNEVPVGAVLVVGGEIVAMGRNRREENQIPHAHAEIEALEAYCRQRKSWRCPAETTLYVTVEPCMMCTGALLWARVDRVIYGCEDPKNAGLRKLRPWIEEGVYDHRFIEIQGGLLANECAEVISGFFQRKRRRTKSLFLIDRVPQFESGLSPK